MEIIADTSLDVCFFFFSVPTVNIVEKETRESLLFQVSPFVVEKQICLKDREEGGSPISMSKVAGCQELKPR